MTTQQMRHYVKGILPRIYKLAQNMFGTAQESEKPVADYVHQSFKSYSALCKGSRRRPNLSEVIRETELALAASSDETRCAHAEA